MSTKAIIVEAVMRDATAADRASVENAVDAFLAIAVEDQFGNLRLPSGVSVESEVKRIFVPAAAKADSAAEERKYPGGRTLAEVQAIKNPEERLALLAEGEGKSPVIGNESWRKSVPKSAGLSPEESAKLSPFEKLQRANEATAKAQGWDYSGWGRDR
jgi:hypothetical protein